MARRSNIRPRGKSWEAYIRINGRQHQKTCKTRDEAELWLARHIELQRRHVEPQRPVRVTFRDAAEAWYGDRGKVKGWSEATRRDYRSALKVHLLPEFGEKTLDEITPARIAAWRSKAMENYVEGRERVELPPRTAQK